VQERAAVVREQGFSLVELLVVLVIISVLLAIAVPSYLGFRGRAADDAARANIRAAFPATSAYSADNNGTATDVDSNAATSGFEGMTIARLKVYDAGIGASVTVHSPATTATAFCLTATESGRTWSARGPGLPGFQQNATCS
jgi:type IV pilus assembly protein PilA